MPKRNPAPRTRTVDVTGRADILGLRVLDRAVVVTAQKQQDPLLPIAYNAARPYVGSMLTQILGPRTRRGRAVQKLVRMFAEHRAAGGAA